METKIILVGVGGQGILTLARMIGIAAIKSNLDVYISEVHGMAQRGGSVIVHLKVGDEVYSPLIAKGDADWLIGLEIIECCRYIDYASKKTNAIINDRLIPPPGTYISESKKKNLIKIINQHVNNTYIIPAHKLAVELGDPILTNSIMFGAVSKLNILNIKKELYLEALQETIPRKHLNVNIVAFKKGDKLIV